METNSEEIVKDPVVREIPIIHSDRLEKVLHLFQYPLRTKDCEHVIKKCFYKPQNQQVKLELAINKDSPNFDFDRAKCTAEEVDAGSKQKIFENGIVDKVVLESTYSVKEPGKYGIAVYNGQELHITPLKGMYQFKPSFPYVGQKRKKEAEKGSDSEDEEAGPSSGQKLTVKFKNSDVKYENSYNALQARSAEEAWMECEWKNPPESAVERLKLWSETTDDIIRGKPLTKHEYIKLLVPEDKEQKPLEPILPSHVLSLHALRALPLLEQCRLLLKDAQIIQFEQLLMVLAGSEGVTAESLLKVLPKVAVLVRGNWVVKSEVLYPQDSFSATSGVPAELMRRARDYILYQFTEHQYVERKKMASRLRIPSEEIKEIFTGVSKLRRHERGWELILPADHDFIYKHAELAHRQTLNWEHRYHQLDEFLKDSGKQQRRKSRSESKSFSEDGKAKGGFNFSSDNDSGNEKNKSPVAGRKNNCSVKVNGAAMT